LSQLKEFLEKKKKAKNKGDIDQVLVTVAKTEETLKGTQNVTLGGGTYRGNDWAQDLSLWDGIPFLSMRSPTTIITDYPPLLFYQHTLCLL